MKRFIITFIYVMFSSVILCGQTASVSKDWKTYSRSEYSICYPQNWEATTQGNQLILMQKRMNNTSFAPNVNVIIEGRKRTETTKYLAEGSAANFKKLGLLTGSAIVEPITLSGMPGHRWCGTVVQQGFRIYERQYVVKEADNTTYIITLAVEDRNKASTLGVAEKILSSFKINTPTKQGVDSVLPTAEEIKDTNAHLPITVAENTVFYKVEYDSERKIQRFYYRFTVKVDETAITPAFIKQRKDLMKKLLQQKTGSMARINAGMTYLYVYHSSEYKKLYEIRIDKSDF